MHESADHLLSLLESAPDFIFTQDLAGKLVRVNRSFERATGMSRSHLLGLKFADIVVPEDRARLDDLLISQAGGAAARTEDFTLVTGSSGRIRVEITFQLAFANGNPIGWNGYGRDVRERDRQQSARALAESRLLETTNELAKFTRHLQLLHRLSNTNYEQLDQLSSSYLAAGCEIFETSCGVLSEITGRAFTNPDSKGSAHALSRDERLELQGPLVAQILSSRSTVTLTGPDAADTPFTFFVGTPILLNNDAYGVISFWNPRDVRPTAAHPQGREVIELMAKRIGLWMDQRRLTDQLAYQAHHDALTGLPNRLFLKDRLESALRHAERDDTKIAVVFIDLDRFKHINDTLGHGIGDVLLQQVAARLKSCMGPNDILARMGGDEFTAILTGFTDIEAAVQTARRLLAAVRRASNVGGFELFVSASLGLAFFPRDGRDIASLLRNADSAMYIAKNRGKNQVHCFSGEGSDFAFERLELEHSLRPALDKNELSIYYQPQVDVGSGAEPPPLRGLEVLLVWDHPKFGRISPGQFIPIAEESGMILPIGSWVLRQACRQAVEWQKAGLGAFRISVNVSALQFAQDNFVSVVSDVLDETGLDPTLLELELTESVVMQDVEQSVSRMAELRTTGVRIAIDDFGTGYSSLSYLRRLPADTLKIDRSFLEEGTSGPGALALIQTIVILAHNMGLSVTAEGIETADQLELIRSAGCDLGQGHLFGLPVTASAIASLLTARRAIEEPALDGRATLTSE